MANNKLFLVSAAALSLAALAVGCGKDDSSGSDDNETGTSTSTETTTGTSLNTSTDTSVGTGTAAGITSTGTGTVTVLTAEQVAKLEESACNAWAVEPEGQASKIEFVIDISSSMSWAAPGGSGTKWEATRTALVDAICGGAAGSGLSAATAVGLLFYPGKVINPVPDTEQDTTSCLNLSGSVPMAQLGDAAGAQRLTVQNALTTIALGQGTPTHDAYKYALDNVVLSSAQEAIAGDPYMLLITDGMPTLQYGCYNTLGRLDSNSVPTQPIVDEVARAAGLGVKTFIIGSPGSEEGRTWLSDAAIAGGTAPAGCSSTGPTYCHMDMTTAPDFSAALKAGLGSVMTQIANCKYNVPTTSVDGTQTVDPNLISPVITYSAGTTELLGVDSTGACAGEGFKLNSATELELCPATCTKFQADGGAKLQLMFGCSAAGVTDILQ